MPSNARLIDVAAVGDEDVLSMLCDQTQLRLAYQPQIDLSDGRIVSVEALARWHHPAYGELPPAVFLPVVRRLKLQRVLFGRVTALALEAIESLRAAGLTLPIAINASAKVLSSGCTLELLRTLAGTYAAGLADLRIELTEDEPAADIGVLRASMKEIRQLGCELALDDFGSGHANLSLLISLPFDEIKLDRFLIASLGDSDVAKETVRFALELGERMGWRVVAEGVSNEAELQWTRALGCRYLQGYLIGRPMPLAQLVTVVRANRERVIADSICHGAIAPARSTDQRESAVR